MIKTFLITGGAGFIGSHLIDNLINQGHKIICVDTFNDYYNPRIKENNTKHHLSNPNFKLYKVDIRDFKSLEEIFNKNKIDTIVHLAARGGVRPSLEQPVLYTEVNINGTVNLLELAKLHDIKKFIFASSSSVYGSQKKGPFTENMNISKPISPYAATKAAGEQLCHVYSHLYKIQINCLRFFTVYGPRQRPDLAIYKFSKLIINDKPIPVYGDGTTKRDYTYIDDIIQGIVAAIDYNKTPFEIFNLGESQTVQLNYLIELLEEDIGKKAIINRQSLQKGDVPLTFADISKAKKLLNYNPQTKIEEGIKKFVDWIKTTSNLNFLI